MTTNKKFKRLVRERMERTGESYLAARQALAGSAVGRGVEARRTDKQEWRRRTVEDLNQVAAKVSRRPSAEWTQPSEIVEVLRAIAKGAPDNHMFFPETGGLDLAGACASHEDGCVELLCGSRPRIVRPARLRLERFPEDRTGDWTYFRLDLAPLSPVCRTQDKPALREELAEVAPAQYDDCSVLERDDCPSAARAVFRLFSGSLVIFAKGSRYNQATGTYLGLHSVGPWGASQAGVSADEFRQLIRRAAMEDLTAAEFSYVTDRVLEHQKKRSRAGQVHTPGPS